MTQPHSNSELDAIESGYWQASGKIGLVYRGKGESAYFDWSNRGDEFELVLHGPFGQGRVQLLKQGDNFTLSDKAGSWRGNTAEAVLEQRLGWSLPVAGLRYWIKGQAAPESAADKRELNPDSQLGLLQQEGWQITFASYHPPPHSHLPRKIIAEREDIKLTVLVKNWRALVQSR